MEQSKKITIIHGGKLLLNSVYPDKFRKNIERRVRERNIDIVSGDYVDEFPEDGTTVELKTRNGKTIKGVDLVVRTTSFLLRFVLTTYYHRYQRSVPSRMHSGSAHLERESCRKVVA